MIRKERLSVSALASEWNTTPKAIYADVARRRIPFRKHGRRVFFFRDEIDEYLKALDGVSVAEAIANERRLRGEVR